MLFKKFMKKRWKIGLFFLIFIFLFSNILAYHRTGNPALVVNTVGRNQLITGYLNISLENETGSTPIKAQIKNTNINSTLTLIELLNRTNLNYDCWYDGQKVACKPTFKEISRSGSISGGIGEKYIGFNLVGDNVVIQNLSFIIEGTSTQESCGDIPLTIDLFADGKKDYLYVNPSDNICWKKFPENFSYLADAFLTTNWYCSNITLKHISGKVKIGGIIKQTNFSNYGVIFFIIKTPKGIIKECNTTDYNDGNYSDVSCDVDIFVEEGNYEVCVRTNVSNTFLIQYGGNKSYGLFAAEYKNKYLSDQVTFDSTIYYEQTGKNLINEINNYINSNYNKNCSNGCIIPLLVNSTQNFIFSNLTLIFNSNGTLLYLSNFSEISLKYPDIDSKGFVSIPLSAFNLTAPRFVGNYTLEIYFGNSIIASKDFKVEDVPIVVGIYPNKVIVNEETEFRVIAYPSPNTTIISYAIDWGDGSRDSNNNGIFKHTYRNIGIYTVTINVTDSRNFVGVGIFNIEVGIDKESLNKTIRDAINYIENFESRLSGEFYKDWLKNLLELNETKNKLNQLLQNLSGNLTQVKMEFDNLKSKIPVNITWTNYPEIYYVPNWEEIDMDNVEKLVGKCNCDEDSCKKSLVLWGKRKLKVSGKKGTIIFYNREKKTITIIYLKLLTTSGKIIVELPSSKISASTSYEDFGNSVGFNRSNVDIAYDEEINPYEIIWYATPTNIGEIKCEEEIEGEPELYKKQKNPFIIFLIILIILVIIGLIIIWAPYIIKNIKMREKEKEKKLFPSTTDYYNLFNFVSNSFRSGKKEEEIRKQLIDAGWKKEQIDYIIKKVKSTIKTK